MDEEIKRQFEEELKRLAERFGITSVNLKNFGDSAKKGSGEFRRSLEELNKEVKRGRAGYADQIRALENLNDAIDDLSDAGEEGAKKARLLADREQLVREAANQRMVEASEKFGKELTETAQQSAGKFTRQLQANASGAELSSTVMNAAIDATGSTLSWLGTKAEAAGAGLALIPTLPSKILGGILIGTGAALDFVGEKGKTAFKFANEILSEELKKTSEAYGKVTTAGAIFSNGLEGMKNSAFAAGLNLAQFSNVIKNHSEDLAFSGGGVLAGAKKVGEVGKIFDANGGYVRKQLQRLGYEYEEQAELTATMMGRMARMGQAFDAGKLAQETQIYAENLRIIAAITGEDAKAKIKQVEEQNDILAFQNIIAQIGGEQAAHMNEYMASLSAADAKSIRDLVINQGAHANIQSAMYESLNTAAAAQNKQIANIILSGRATMQNIGDAQTQYADAIIQGGRQMTDVGRAAFDTGDSMLTGVSADLLESLQHHQKIRDGAFKKSEQDLAQAKKPSNELTEGFIAASSAAQALSVDLEKVLLPLLDKYVESTGTMLTGMKNLIDMVYGAGSSGKSPGGFVPTYKPPPGAKPTDLTGLPGDKRTIAEKQKADEDVKAGRKSYNSFGFDQPNIDPYEVKPKGKALGGISTGPVSGYTELLHGTEAVVPLADNRSIPVSLDSSSLTAAMNQQTGVLAEILRAMQSNNSMTSQIAMNTV